MELEETLTFTGGMLRAWAVAITVLIIVNICCELSAGHRHCSIRDIPYTWLIALRNLMRYFHKEKKQGERERERDPSSIPQISKLVHVGISDTDPGWLQSRSVRSSQGSALMCLSCTYTLSLCWKFILFIITLEENCSVGFWCSAIWWWLFYIFCVLT